MKLSLIDAEVTYDDFQVPFAKSRRIHVPKIDKSDFIASACSGIYNSESKEIEFTINLDLRLSKFSEIAHIAGIQSALHIKIMERGTLDRDTGDFSSHASGISINHTPSLLAYKNSKKDCKAKPTLAGAIDHVEEFARVGNSLVYICPGKSVELGWMIDKPQNVTKAVIQPDGIVINSADYAHGKVTVKPQKSTDYKLSIDTTACKAVESGVVQVVVVEDGTNLLISAQPSGGGVWTANLPPQLYDPHITMTSIQSVDCLSRSGINLTWTVRKVDINGTVTNFIVTGVPDTPVKVPVAGSWAFFLPVDRQTGNACFNLTVAC